ncbi:MAG: biotin/lipoyl-binding protein [Ardenticatenaceae bacterium]|nr:biotin/lipoyl-binding protein [Anaerolineales bacterium]MCB8918817.1 biotin/lipoyl-binding protein [Ardenticatenaceae bacterium]
MKYITSVQGQEYVIEIDREDQIVINGEPYRIDFAHMMDGDTVSLLLNNRSIAAVVEERDDTWEVLIQGELYSVVVRDERAHLLAKARANMERETGEERIQSPMPGLILEVLVQPGEVVTKGQKVIILESMKMENELRTGRDGVVVRVHTAKGDTVEKGQALVTIGELDSTPAGAS